MRRKLRKSTSAIKSTKSSLQPYFWSFVPSHAPISSVECRSQKMRAAALTSSAPAAILGSAGRAVMKLKDKCTTSRTLTTRKKRARCCRRRWPTTWSSSIWVWVKVPTSILSTVRAALAANTSTWRRAKAICFHAKSALICSASSAIRLWRVLSTLTVQTVTPRARFGMTCDESGSYAMRGRICARV